MKDTVDEHSPMEVKDRFHTFRNENQSDQLIQVSCTPYRKYERKEIHCPFTWNECCKSLKSASLSVKLDQKLSAEDVSPWHKFCYQMLLICRHIQKEEEEKALAMYESCGEILFINRNENFFKEILEGLEHVLKSCKLFLFVEKGDNEAARLIFSQIKSFQVLNQVCQAAVLAVKACISVLFGLKGYQEALTSIKAAIELDPDEMGIRKGAWYALAGRTCAEIRNYHGHSMMPSLEERHFLERSIQKNPFLENYIYLADTYRQTAKVLFLQSPKNKEEAEELNKIAKKMYEDAINDESATIMVLQRAGMGLIKLSKRFRNVELAKIVFDKILKIDPNSKGALLGLGHLMNWCMNDYEEALKYYERASLIAPVGNYVIQMKILIDKNYNPLEDCDKYIEREKDMILGGDESSTYFFLVKAEFFLFKENLIEAVHCWEKALESVTSGKELWDYKNLFMKEEKVKFSVLITDRINHALKQKMDKSDVEYLRKILKLSNSTLSKEEKK